MQKNIYQWILPRALPVFLLSGCESLGGLHLDDGQPAPRPHSSGYPPAHAPAHGQRRKHQYYYYLESAVYFDIGREMYFYLSGDRWRISATLPGRLRSSLSGHVEIELDSDKPYHEYKSHRKKYPPGQHKKKKKNKKGKKNKKWDD